MNPRPLLTVLAYALALWPQGQWFVTRTFDRSDEPLGLLALLTAGALAWSRRKQLQAHPRWGVGGLIVTVAASFFLPPLLTAILAVLTIAIASGLFRNPGLASLLVLALPLLSSFEFYISWPLRLGVSTCSEVILNIFGWGVTREGTLLLYQTAEVGVDAPCSGVHMLWFTAYLACTLAAVYSVDQKHFLLLIPFALLASLTANIIRATILFFPEAGLLSLPAWTHEGIGIILHLITALLLSTFIKRTTRTTKCLPKHHSSSSVPASA